MRMLRLTIAALLTVAALGARATAHCQVPCGIFNDDLRFALMLEDAETIAKAIDQVVDLAATHDATGHNQLERWVATKEDHAGNVQKTIAEYFMAQRIKTEDPAYGKKLMASHAVMVAAMKAKQTADPASAETLKKAILSFYEAYAGKAYQAPHIH